MNKKREHVFLEFLWFLVRIPYWIVWALYYIFKSTVFRIISVSRYIKRSNIEKKIK